jgi:LPS export ABC transporter protein LptC
MRWMLLSIVAVASLASCRKETRPPVVGQTLADSAEQIIYSGHFLLTHEGVKRGELFSDTIYVFNDQTRFALRRVRATFNTDIGGPNGTLRGDRGTYDLRTHVLEGFGNVVVTSTDGKRLTSPHLRFVESTNQISSDSSFTLVRERDVQRGIGFVSDPNVTVFRCLRQCSGSANVPLREITP